MERKEEKSNGVQKLKKAKKVKKAGVLSKVSMFLYKQACIRKLPLFSSRQVESDLLQLHPGENLQYLKTEYYVKKLSLTLTVLLAGGLFGIFARISAESSVLLQPDGKILRNSYQEGKLEIQVAAELGEETQDFYLQLWPRSLSQGETQVLADQFFQQLPELISGKNESLFQVTEDLILEENYEGYPFWVEWESSRPDLLNSSGTVQPPAEPQQVQLFARLSYEGYFREESLSILLVPMEFSDQERLKRELEEYLILTEQESRSEETFELPDEWQGSNINWRQQVEDNSLLLWAAALVAAVLVYLFTDKDLHGQLEKRRKQLRAEYPGLVLQLLLFIGAGMTVRGAFQRLATDYERKRKITSKKLPAYEEMLHVCHELQSGVSEGAAFEHFGRRCGLQEYIRLSALLMQNLKRGNSSLLGRLREEADKASGERLQQSRRLGEEAGTKLLVPMVMMLAVVMVIIMVPAFSAM